MQIAAIQEVRHYRHARHARISACMQVRECAHTSGEDALVASVSEVKLGEEGEGVAVTGDVGEGEGFEGAAGVDCPCLGAGRGNNVLGWQQSDANNKAAT